MVYSTCTLNPIENEAVVTELLRICGPALELVDCGNQFQRLARGGLSTWQVGWESKKKKPRTDEPYAWYSSIEDVPSHLRGARILA